MGDRGLPTSWREMNGYGSHTYQWINAEGERFWVQYHFKSRQGVHSMDNDEAEKLAGSDADYYRRDLYENIEAGNFPTWDVFVQVMPYEDAKTYRFNPFDITKVWPHADYPLIPVGHFTLNRNPKNFFAEIEQAAFSPSNLVPGIDISPDKMLMARVFSYPDAQRNRIGTNYNQLPVNQPHASHVTTYMHEGSMQYHSTTPMHGSTPRTPSAGPQPSRPVPARAAGRPTASWFAPRRPCAARTATSARPERCTATSSPPSPRNGSTRTCSVRSGHHPR